MVNFSELKESIKIEDVVSAYGITMTRKGSQWRGECPCGHGGDRALAVNTDKGSAYCFGAKSGGDLIWLVSHIKGCSQREAAEDIAKKLGVTSSTAPPGPEKRRPLSRYAQRHA